MNCLDIYIDGAAKGNPGPAGIGVVIYKDGAAVKSISRHIGSATNNIAEYSALIYALQEALILKSRAVNIRTDSELLCRQLTGRYKVKHENLKPLFERVKHLRLGFDVFKIQHIYREKNKEADKLASLAACKKEIDTE